MSAVLLPVHGAYAAVDKAGGHVKVIRMTTHVGFRIADDEDVAGLVSLYDGAARWMRSRGIEQ